MSERQDGKDFSLGDSVKLLADGLLSSNGVELWVVTGSGSIASVDFPWGDKAPGEDGADEHDGDECYS